MRKILNRPYDYSIHHSKDVYYNLGYDYRENILKKTLSPEIFANEKTRGMLNHIQKMVYMLIEEVKQIKTAISFAHDKNAKNLN